MRDEQGPADLRPVATARGLQVRYGRTEIFNNLNLDLASGATGLVGPNGAGKSTLMKLLAGVIKPAAGSLEVMGQPLAGASGRSELPPDVGYLPQVFGFQRSYKLREFVEYVAWLQKVPAGSRANAVKSTLQAVGLSDRAESKMKTLSGGMVRRAGIAAALVHKPSLLLLDEPSTGLDPKQRLSLRSLLSELAESTNLVVSTHLVEDVHALCSSLVVLDSGEVRYSGGAQVLGGAGQGVGALEARYLALLDDNSGVA